MKKHNRKAGIARLIFVLLSFCLLINVSKASAETKETSRQELFNEAAVLKYIAVKNPQINDYLKELKKKDPQEYFRTMLLYENMREAEKNLDKNDNSACPECADFAQRLKKGSFAAGKEDEKRFSIISGRIILMPTSRFQACGNIPRKDIKNFWRFMPKIWRQKSG